VARNIDRMKDEDIKNTHRQSIVDVILNLQEVSQSSYENKSNVLRCEFLALEAAYRYLVSPFFDSKLKAIIAIKDTLEKTIDHSSIIRK
jgi:hypothetical protein